MTEELVLTKEGIAAWRAEAPDEVKCLAGLARSGSDAADLLRVGYSHLFKVLPRREWKDFDDLSALIAGGWGDLRALTGALQLATRIANDLDGLTTAVARGRVDDIGHFAAGAVLFAATVQAVARRVLELAEDLPAEADGQAAPNMGAAPAVLAIEAGQSAGGGVDGADRPRAA
jgi:hypothetical protein